MTCREADEIRMERASLASALLENAREHVRTCQRCRPLQSLLDSEASDNSVPPEVESRITRQITSTLHPVSPLPTLRVLTTLLLLIAGLVISAEAWCVGGAGWDALSLRQTAVVFLALGVGLVIMARVVTGQMIPASRRWLSPAWAISLISLVLVTAIINLFPYQHDPKFFTRGLRCWMIGSCCSVVSALFFSPVLRRSAWLSPIGLGVSTGFLSGLVGLTVLEIFCPYLYRDHVGVWHFGSALTCTLLGFIIGVVSSSRRSVR